MNPGQKIPSTKVTVENDFTGLVASAHVIGAVSAKGSSPDLTTTYIVNNKSITSPLNNVTAPLAQIPTGTPAPGSTGFWLDEATGTTSALTVPATASGAILVNGPSNFTIQSQLSGNADGSNPFPSVLVCSAPAGEDLSLGRITVEPAGAQQVDVTNDYVCDLYGLSPVPSDRVVLSPQGFVGFPITNEIKATLPASVSPGGTVAATDVTDTWQMPTQYAGIITLVGGQGNQFTVNSTIPDAALGVTVNGQATSSLLNNIAQPATLQPTSAPIFETDTGTTSAISVPENADSDVTISAPRQFEIDATLTPSAATPTTFTSPSFECTAADDEDLTLATIHVAQPPAHASLTAASPKSSVFGKSVSVPVGTSVASVTPKPAPAGGTQSIDGYETYTCSVFKNQTSVPTDGTTPELSKQNLTAHFTASLPAAVNPGATIPATNTTVTWQVPDGAWTTFGLISDPQAGAAGIDNISIAGAALGAEVNGQTTDAPLTGMSSTTLSPQPAASPWLVETDGSTSAITVPANATSDLTIKAPGQFSFLFTAEPTADETAAGDTPVPFALQCTAADPLSIATVRVVRPLPTITHPVPTGKVLIMRGSKGVAQGTIVKGKANVVIPGTALPVGKNTLTVKYTGDSNTLAATPKTITVVKTKTSPTLAVHVTPGKVAAGAIFPTVNVRLTGPGKAKGGKITVTAGTVHKTATLLFDGTTSVQLPPFATAGHKLIRVAYAGNANFVAKTVTTPLNVTKTGLGKFVVKVKPAKVIAKKTRATLLITLGAPDKLNHGLVTVRLAGRIIAKKLIAGAGKITLPKFPSAGRKLLHLTFAGNGSVISKTVTHAVKVTKAPKHHRK